MDAVEVRVLGCLIEKEITTPEYYPLTLNALVNACNQKNNRDPVVNYDEATVDDALRRLRAKGLSTVLTGGGNRVPKHSHRVNEKMNFGRRDLAIICELMLRSPQTLGELNARTERMHKFGGIDEVEACVNSLIERGLVARYPAGPGRKEPRYGHLLSGELPAPAAEEPVGGAASPDRLRALEGEIAELREKLGQIEREWTEFRKQFE